MDKTSDEVIIIDFTNDLQEPIKNLNYEWLQKYFKIEKRDEISLADPKKYIIDKGGFIFYASVNGEIIGTASLIKMSDTVFELSKMAVTADAKGKGIGTALIEHCFKIAKEKRIEKLILYSNTKLEAAIHLYKKFGFREIALEHGVYERANIKMEKYL